MGQVFDQVTIKVFAKVKKKFFEQPFKVDKHYIGKMALTPFSYECFTPYAIFL